MWGATATTKMVSVAELISIHAPMWGATIDTLLYHIEVVNFNPRTHVGCDRRLWLNGNKYSNFNPRTHVGCDVANDQWNSLTPISIHAPMWGATKTL